jgi:DmsE family decaheme c-type cytochrome
VETRNDSCQACHENGAQLLWDGSAHQQENLACNDCHRAHQPQDLALDEAQSQQMCLDCHAQVRAELHLPSRHPIVEGKTACVDCHNPHGGLGDAALHQPTLNDNCFSCHQDKRGPFLWEHPPAAEDCALCHRPHGSVNERLLTARGPALCQQCHAAAFHPSVPYGSEGLPGGNANQNVLGKNCLNCHSQVHGSNHPSGARLTR